MIRFLQTRSERTKKIVFGTLLLLICGAMVITLIPGGFLGDAFGFGSPGQGVLAKVGDQEVTVTEAQRMVRQMLQQQFGNRGNLSSLMPIFLPRAVQNLIARKVLVLEAERMGLRVSNEEVADWLQHGPLASVLFPNGQFIGTERYEEFTERAMEQTVPQFEEAIKTELLIEKLRSVVESGVTVTDEQLRQAYIRRNTKVKFDYALLTREDVAKQIHLTDAELKAYYDANQKLFANSIPEKRKFQYVVIDLSQLQDKAKVDAADLKNYYSSHMDEFRVPEEVKVRHILIKAPAPGPDGKVDPQAMAAARAKAGDILKKIKAGGNFADLAKKDSEDPGSAPQGGELGWVQRGRTVPEFERVAFSLPVGQTSDLVQSSYGFHILQVEEKHTAHVKSLDEVKAQIEPLIARQKAATMAESTAGAVQVEARSGGLAAAAAKHGLQVMTSPLASRSDTVPGIGNAPEFMAAVFEAKDKNPPAMAPLPQGYAVFQVVELQPPATPTFDQAKSQIEEAIKDQRTGELLAQKLQELSDRARAGHDLKKAAAEVGATVHSSELVGPESQVPDIGALTGAASVVFSMKTGDVSSPIRVQRGGAVLAVVQKQLPEAAGFVQQREEIRQTLLTQKRSEAVELFVDSLRQRMEKEGKIHINKEELDRLAPKSDAS